MNQRFSDRHGYRPTAGQITVREDAPSELRDAITMIAKSAGMQPDAMRQVICEVLLKQPDPNNWSPYPNIWNEVMGLVEDAPWYKVYDIAEALHSDLAARTPWAPEPADAFEKRLNDFVIDNGIGWVFQDGQIVHRGSDSFARRCVGLPQGRTWCARD